MPKNFNNFMFLNPEEIIINFEIRHGMIVADFGSGSGHFVMAVAKKLAGTGVVYAIDVQKNLLEALKSKAEKDSLSNVEIIWADIEGKEGTKLASCSVDFAILSNILFQVDNKESVAKECFRVLRNGGRAAVIDWTKMIAVAGLTGGKVVARQEAERIFLQEGFIEGKDFSAGDNHYGIMFRKP